MEFIFLCIGFILILCFIWFFGALLRVLFIPLCTTLIIWFCFWFFTLDNEIIDFVKCKDRTIASIFSEVGTLSSSEAGTLSRETCSFAQCRVFEQLDDLLEKGDIIVIKETLSSEGDLISSTIIKSIKIDPKCD